MIESLSFPSNFYYDRNKFIINNFDNFIRQKGEGHVIPIYPGRLICENIKDSSCIIINNSKAIYLDDDHLSDFGARLIVDQIFNFLNN